MRAAGAVGLGIAWIGRTLRKGFGFSLLVFGGYLLAAFLAKNFYPFSVFDMYAGQSQPSASRIVARDAAGRLHPVSDYAHWQCPRAVVPDPEKCSAFPFYYIPYVDEGVVRYIENHSVKVDGGEPVDLVFHIWRFGSRGIAAEQDCVIQRCRAEKR